MKPKTLILILSCLLMRESLAQECDCRTLASKRVESGKGIIPNEDAQRVVDGLLREIPFYKIRTENDRIIPIEETCTNIAIALRPCSYGNVTRRYILYNNKFLKVFSNGDAKITWGDRFIMTHEIGHHVFVHHFGSPENQYTRETNKMLPIDQKSYMDEFESDALAIAVLYNLSIKGGIVKNVREEIRRDIKNVLFLDKLPGKSGSLTHPSFEARLAFFDKFWERLSREKGLLQKLLSGQEGKGFSDYVVDWYSRFYGRKPFWEAGIALGAVGGLPQFSANNESVPAMFIPNYTVGLSISRFNWYKPIRFACDLKYNPQFYYTYTEIQYEKRTVETISTQNISLQPKLILNKIGLRKDTVALKSNGWLASVGLSFNYPISYKYENNVNASTKNDFKIGSTVNPVLGVGYEWVHTTKKTRNFKLFLNYSPQKLGVLSDQNLKTFSHNISLEFTMRVYPKFVF